MLPVNIIQFEDSCTGTSVCIERTTQRSSAKRATSGNSSLISNPDWPCRLNLNGEGSSPPVPFSVVRPAVLAGRCPAYWSRAGLGSNVSTCEGAPFIQRWIIRFALAGKCAGFRASGLLELPRIAGAGSSVRAS